MSTPPSSSDDARGHGPQGIGARQWIAIAVILVLGALAGFFILRSEPHAAGDDGHGHGGGEARAEAAGHDDAKGHGEEAAHADHGDEAKDAHAHDEAEPEAATGRHGGQQLVEGDIGAEVLLDEAGGEPRLKVWLSRQGEPLAAAGATLGLTLKRPGGVEESIGFGVEEGVLVSRTPIAEPHVFQATLVAEMAGEPFVFGFSRDEGKVALSDAQLQAAGIGLDRAAPAPIRQALQLPGEIRFNADRTAHVVPRVAAVVERVAADLGQSVRKGQVLAVLSSATVSEQRAELETASRRRALAQTAYERERKLWEQKIAPEQDVLQARQLLDEADITLANARQKLRALGAGMATGGALGRIELRAPFDGVVVEKHLALGEAVREDSNVFVIADLSSVWAEFSVGPSDLPQVRVGERAVVRATAFDAQAPGTVSYVGALIGEQTRTALARVVLPNPQGTWRPGLFVNVELVAQEAPAPVTVPAEALQTQGEQPVVYVRVPGGFVPQPVQPGRSDGRRVEIRSGLAAGAPVASAGSFIVKSEQGKGSATHSH